MKQDLIKKNDLKSFWNKHKCKGEVNNGISQTVPNEALTVREVITRFANGTLPPIAKTERVYSGDMEDIRFLDISEVKSRIEHLKSVQEEGKAKIKELQEIELLKKKEAKEKEIAEKAVEEYKSKNPLS